MRGMLTKKNAAEPSDLLMQMKTKLTSWLSRPVSSHGTGLAPFLRNKIAQLVILIVQVIRVQQDEVESD